MNKPTPTIYRTTNWSSYNQALINWGNISIWFDLNTQWYTHHKASKVSDSQVLEDLLAQVPWNERIDSVYTDSAYDTKLCRQEISDRHAHAVIPPRKNAKPLKDNKTGSLERNELLKTIKCLGRTLWKSGLGIIGVAWSKQRCIASNLMKQCFSGDKISSRNFDSQANDIHARLAILNKFTELGRLHTQVVT